MSQTAAQTVDSSSATAASNTDDGKVLSLVCYIIPIIGIVPLVQKQCDFAIYHAKQSFTLVIASILAQIVLIPVGIVLGLTGLGVVSVGLSLVFLAAVIGLVVIGAMNSWAGKLQPLPVIGRFGERIFGGARQAS